MLRCCDVAMSRGAYTIVLFLLRELLTAPGGVGYWTISAEDTCYLFRPSSATPSLTWHAHRTRFIAEP